MGSYCTRRTSIIPSIASRMFARACSLVFPYEAPPGSAGHSATIWPSSLVVRVTMYLCFMTEPNVKSFIPVA
jgi:hypothetical protein